MISLSVCMDTCHIHDAGYNIVEDFDGVLNEFDKIVGIDRIKVLHINDSKNERGAHKDRHENIGFGHIGFDALSYIVHHPQLMPIPKILETPFVGEDKNDKKAPYKFEIEMLRNKAFDDTVLEKIMKVKKKRDYHLNDDSPFLIESLNFPMYSLSSSIRLNERFTLNRSS